MNLWQVEQGFSSFFAKIGVGQMCCKTLKNHQIYHKKLAKNEEKPCSTCHTPIFRLIPGT